eukprot:5439579-Prymnesium_polylepis.1
MVRCSAFAAFRVGPRRAGESLPREARLSQFYVAWGEGLTFAALAPLLVRKHFRSLKALSQ